MSSFLAIKKTFELSASNNTQMLAGRQSRELSATNNDVVTTMKKHFDYTVNVSFDSTGGTSCENATYVLGQAYNDLPSSTKPSYLFQGWYTASSGGTEILSSSIVELSNTILYAQWKESEFGNDYTEYVAVATSSYKKTGIYSATRYSSASVITVDWGDGNLEEIDGNISQLAHEYESAGTYHVKVSNNITTFAPSYNDSTWYGTTSQNRYTFKDMVKTGSRLSSTSAMPNQAFYYCAALSSVNFLSSCYTGLTAIPPSSFFYCTSISATQLSVLPSRIIAIQAQAFRYAGLSGVQDLRNTGITSLTANYIFASNANLAEVKLPSNIGATMGTYTFSGTSISVCEIPSSLTAIPNYCFNGSLLRNIAIPANIRSINASAFRSCINLSFITYETTALTSIGNYAFYQNYNLSNLNVPDTVKSIGGSAYLQCYNATAPLTLPAALTSLGTNSYQYCYSLKELTIPSGLTAIGNTAFSGCRALSSITDNRLTAQTTGANTFGSAAGTGTTAYTGYSTRGSNILWVPEGATGYDSSYWLDPLQNASKCGFNLSVIGSGENNQLPTPSNGKVLFKTSSNQADWSEEDAYITIDFLDNNGIVFNGFNSLPDAVNVIIPSKDEDGNDVTTIDDSAFAWSTNLINVIIPSSITNIMYQAFAGSTLTNITIPSNVANIGEDAFAYCNSLTSIIFQGKTLAQVQAMDDYPWGIIDTSIIEVE